MPSVIRDYCVGRGQGSATAALPSAKGEADPIAVNPVCQRRRSVLWLRYYRPESIGGALEILSSEHGRARLVTKATDLVIQLKRGELQTDALVDVTRIRSLQFVRRNGAKIEIGALVTHAEVAQSELVYEQAPVLCATCSQVGSP